MQAQSAAANAVMFDRSSGVSCDECLERCSKHFQNHSSEWICRSLTYDHRWKICDLFAVNGGDSPYNLLDFEGRDYFQYMPALPPTDSEMLGLKQNEILEHFNTNNEKQCSCPCKALSELTAQRNIPLNLTGSENGEKVIGDSTLEVKPIPVNNASALENAADQLFGTKNIEIEKSLENQSTNSTTLSSPLPINSEQNLNESSINSLENNLIINSTLIPPSTSSIESIPTEITSTISPPSQNSSVEEQSPPIEIGKSFGSKTYEFAIKVRKKPVKNIRKRSPQKFVRQDGCPPPSLPYPHKCLISIYLPISNIYIFKKPQKDVQLNKNVDKPQLIQRPIIKQQKIATNNVCPKIGQIAYYAEIEGKIQRKNNGKIEKINDIKNSRDCLDICDGQTKTNCNSAQWTTTEGCELYSNFSTQIISPQSLLTFLPSTATENAKYYEKVCVNKNILKDESRRTFVAIPGYILVGHVQEVSNAGSLSECLKACLSASADYGFTCKSLMFYPSDQEQNCLMNSESRHTQSDVFVPEEQNVEFMIYLDLDTPQQKLLPSTINEQRRFYDSPINEKLENKTSKEEETWTHWSKCLNSETAAEMRHRYLKCRESKDIRKCPKETIPCGKKKPTIKIQKIWHSDNNTNQQKLKLNEKTNAFSNILSECRAVRDALGRKKCPYGMRF
ncbi:unnamed protein product [Meloidogyne enterolobii]|uniref:Uncharacterized protein n=1 Tax=Meloidogyne enterolobii TaxID=390850 RepID=A0ACB0ZTI4_MELEN